MNQTFIVRLIKITLITGEIYRYQNFQRTAYTFDAQSFDYLPFSIESDPQRNLEFESSGATIAIANTALIRSYLLNKDAFREALVELYTLFPDVAGSTPVVSRLQVQDTSFEEAAVVFSLRSSTSAVRGRIPTKFFNTNEFPELPQMPVRLR